MSCALRNLKVLQGWMGLVTKPIKKHKIKNNKSLGIKSTKCLKGSKIQKRLVSSLGGKSEIVGSDEFENGGAFIGNESTASIWLGHVVSEQDYGDFGQIDRTN